MPRNRRSAFGDGRVTIEEVEVPEEEEQYEDQEEEVDEDEEEEDEDEEEESEDEEEEDEDEEEEEEQNRENVDVTDSQNESEERKNQKISEGACSSSGLQEDVGLKPGETEGISCLICMEVWTDGGQHQVCCLPCGHLYGFSCIKKWLQKRRSAGKCPQCNKTCRLKDVRKIYASRIAAVDDEAHKRILSLEATLSSVKEYCESRIAAVFDETEKRISFVVANLSSFDKKLTDWSNKEAQWKKREAELLSEVSKLKKKITTMESTTNVASQEQYVPGHKIYQEHHGLAPSCCFRQHGELLVSGGRMFDIDGSRERLLLARRLPGAGGTYVLSQMGIHSGEIDDIMLPPTTRAIKDLHLSPHNNGLVVFGSLGKKISVISLESHNTVLSYDLAAAPWCCSWDRNSSHHIYAGLQNGMVLVFDMRQTVGPCASLTGLTTNPVHTIHHLSTNSTPTSDVRTLLSASSIGLCQWNINGSEESPSLVAETGNGEVCISSSFCPRSDHIVASYRPNVGSSDDTVSSQTQTGVDNSNSNGVDGFHVCFKRRGVDSYYQKLSSKQAFVDAIRLPRTAIIDFGEERKQLFASCDESTRELVLQEPSSFTVSQRFPLLSLVPLQDVKYTHVNGTGLLGLLTDDRLQLLRNESP